MNVTIVNLLNEQEKTYQNVVNVETDDGQIFSGLDINDNLDIINNSKIITINTPQKSYVQKDINVIKAI